MRADLPQRSVIAASWQRAGRAGLVPDARPEPVVRDVAEADPLLDAARPVLARAASILSGTDTALLLVDSQCRMVSHVSGGSTVERWLDHTGLVNGVGFDETQMGTTALGTTAEVRADMVINGEEHYLEQFKQLSCFGRPIIHPASRRLTGIICMTEVAPKVNPLSVPLIRGLVDDIADRLLDRSHSDHRAVIAAFQQSSARRDLAVAAVGDDLQLTNALAAELLAPGDFGTLRAMVDDPADGIRRVTLMSGIEADVGVDRIPGVRHSAVFWLRPRIMHRTDRPPPTTAARPASVGAVAICGEAGTGRSTRARTLLPDAVVVDVAAALLSGTAPDLVGAFGRARKQSRGVIVDGTEFLDDRSLKLIHSALTAAGPSLPPMVLVSEPAAGSTTLAAVVACCRRRESIPPLRHRGGELAALGQQWLERIDPALRLSPDAADALLSQDWPGNLTELGIVMEQSAATTMRRGSRQVTAADLPDGYRNSTRASRLMGREQAERQAIIAALHAADGNKSHAAKALGVSRTTLYARIRALGIGR